MPRAPKTSTDTPKPHARRKPRPRFEVAPELVAAPAAAWVYRDTEPVTEPSPQATAAAEPTAADTIPMLAFGAFAVGIGTLIHIALFAVKTLNTPFRLATGMVNRMRR